MNVHTEINYYYYSLHALNDHRLANGHVSPISSNNFPFSHAVGDIGYSLYYEKDMGAATSVRYSKRSVRFKQWFSQVNGPDVQSNVRCVRWSERSRCRLSLYQCLYV